jgi:hypothetical protein
MNRNDRTVRFLLGLIAALLAVNLLVQMNQSAAPRMALGAGIPDSGAQMQAVVDQVTELNKKVDRLDSFLESGKLTVNVAEKAAK